MATLGLNQPVQNTQLPMVHLATLFMEFWEHEAGDFKHLSLKRTYEGTNYVTIEQQTYNDAISEADNILRFNLYYIMQQIQNIKNVVIHFTRLGFLTLDKKDEITSNSKHSSLMGLQFMKELIKIKKAKFAVVEKALIDTDNKKVWDLLKPATTVTVRSGATAGTSGTTRKPRSVEDRWNCTKCTSPNPQSVNSCLVCAISRAVITDEWTCNCCTSRNDEILRFCSVCERPRHAVQPLVNQTAAASGGQGANAQAGNWACTSCTYENTADDEKCVVCKQDNLDREDPLGDHGPQVVCHHCDAGNVATAVRCTFCHARLEISIFDSSNASDSDD